jgi:cell division protein FtsL
MNTAAKALAQSAMERSSLMAGLLPRRYLLSGLLALGVFFSGLSVIYMQDYQRRFFIESQALVSTQNQMQTEWGQLLLEQSAWSMQARIERVANVKLKMQLPSAKSVVMIQE